MADKYVVKIPDFISSHGLLEINVRANRLNTRIKFKEENITGIALYVKTEILFMLKTILTSSYYKKSYTETAEEFSFPTTLIKNISISHIINKILERASMLNTFTIIGMTKANQEFSNW